MNAIVSGCAAGILGLTGLVGFAAFFLTTFILSLMMYVKMGYQPKPYFKKGEEIWTEGVMQALMVSHARTRLWSRPIPSLRLTRRARLPRPRHRASPAAVRLAAASPHRSPSQLMWRPLLVCSFPPRELMRARALPQSYILFWTLFYDIVHIY